MKLLRKPVSVIMAALLLFFALSVAAPASFAAPAVIGSGACGEHAVWTLTDDGTLTISGTGEVSWPMTEEVYNEETGETETKDLPAPWDAALDQLVNSRLGYASNEEANAAMESGQLKLGEYYYTDFRSIRAILIEEGITAIPDSVFLGYLPETVSLPSTMQQLPENAFSFAMLKDLYLYNPAMELNGMDVFVIRGETTIKTYDQWTDYYSASFVSFIVYMVYLASILVDEDLKIALEPYPTVDTLVSALKLLYSHELNARETYKTRVEYDGMPEEEAAAEQQAALAIAVELAHNTLRNENFAALCEIQEIGALEEALRLQINAFLQKDFSLQEMFDLEERTIVYDESYSGICYDVEQSDALSDAMMDLLFPVPDETIEYSTVALGEATEDTPFPWVTIHGMRGSTAEAAAKTTGVSFAPLDPAAEQPADENVCSWCGKTHEGFFQRIIAFFHRILAKLFGERH